MSEVTLESRTVKGLSWSFFSQAGRQLIQFVIAAILARLLSPQDFGLVGMITVFTGLATILAEMGVGAAIIQKQNLKQEDYSSAFWLSILISACITLIMIFSAPSIAAFYSKPVLKPMLIVLSLNFIIGGAGTVQQAILMKKMNFKAIAARDVGAIVAGGVVGILMSTLGYGAWSLIGQLFAITIVNTLLLWALSPWRPTRTFSPSAVRKLFGFSASVTGSQILTYFSRNIDYLLIGKMLGALDLGLYTLAYKLMLFPLQNISWTITRVAFPAFSSIQDDLTRVSKNYTKMIHVISIITFPLMFGLYVMAPNFVHAVYGPQWKAAIPLIQIFCIVGLLQSITTTTGIIYQAVGRPDIQFKFLLFIGFPTAAISIWLGVPYGIKGVALFYTARTVLVTYIGQYIANRLIKLRWFDFWLAQKEAALGSLIIAVVAFLSAKAGERFSHNAGILFAGQLMAVTLCYLGMIWFTNVLNVRDKVKRFFPFNKTPTGTSK